MAYLRQIELHLDSGTYSEQERTSFLLTARCCCNYLERQLRQLRLKSKYSRLIIICTRDPLQAAVAPLKHEPYLEAIIPFDAKPVQGLSEKAIHQQVMQAVVAGMTAARRFTPMPLRECQTVLKSFQTGGFVNRWVAREKGWSRKKCRCEVAADMTLDRLTLTQRVYVDDELVAEKLLAETKPREGLYEHFLGDFALDPKGRIQYRAGTKILTVFDPDARAFVQPASRGKAGAARVAKRPAPRAKR
jgi:hypothetical protein